MNVLRSIAKATLPLSIRRRLRSVHREGVFRRAMARFLKDPGACADPACPVIADLRYGWGNEAWSASCEYLAEGIACSFAARGPVLECGSGLSTLLLGVVAQRTGCRHWSLEHSPAWATVVQQRLDRYGIDTVSIAAKPLKDYGDCCWYDPPMDSLPDRFALVVCDGPPSDTKGGRQGLVPVMGERLVAGCVILVDDVDRDQELAMARLWERQLGASFRMRGTTRPYVELTVS